MPTYDEWLELYQNTTFTWADQNSVIGIKFSAPNGNSIFIPAAGYYIENQLYDYEGHYWSSSLMPDYPLNAGLWSCNEDEEGGLGMSSNARANGLSVRPVRSSR